MARPIFISVLFFIVVLFSFFKIHGSSVGMYNILFFGNTYKDENLLFGIPRDIRSDEWVVITPLSISQSLNNFHHFNENVVFGQELSVLLDIPTNHWSTLFKPFNWSFLTLPLENAFAFKWWFRGAALIFSIHLLVMSLTKNNNFISITTSLIIFFSPFVQWWYSGSAGAGGVIETVTFGSLATYFFIKLSEFKNKLSLVLNSIFLSYFSICYFLIFYPPFQVSVGLFFLFFIIGHLLNNLHSINKRNFRKLAISLALVAFFILIPLLIYYSNFKEIINTILTTSYPGKREVVGGQYDLIRFFSGYFNILNLVSSISVPQIFGNKSEAASFFLWYPFILPLVIIGLVKDWLYKRKVDFILLFLCLYLLLATIWIFLGLPKIISKLLLLNLVPENRMILGIGLANIFLAIYYLCYFRSFSVKKLINLAIIIAFAASTIHIFIGLYLQFTEYLYVRSGYIPFIGVSSKLILILIFVYFSLVFLVARNIRLFLSTVLLYSILSTIGVNPLYRGLDPLVNSKVATQILSINEKGSKWIIYDNLFLSHYLAAYGIKTVSGVMIYPQFDVWQKFDPNNNYLQIYNRYAHVTYGYTLNDKIEFKLISPDHFRININPCNNVLNELGVKYHIFSTTVNYPCLRMVKSVEGLRIPLYIFKRL